MSDGAVIYLEDTMFEGGEFVEDGLDASGLGVGEENLSETLAADKGDELFDAWEVEFVEDIVEKQDGFYSGMVEEVLELGEFQGKGETLLLSLGAEFLQGKIRSELQQEVILVRARIGILRIAVGLSGGFKLQLEGLFVATIGKHASFLCWLSIRLPHSMRALKTTFTPSPEAEM